MPVHASHKKTHENTFKNTASNFPQTTVNKGENTLTLKKTHLQKEKMEAKETHGRKDIPSRNMILSRHDSVLLPSSREFSQSPALQSVPREGWPNWKLKMPQLPDISPFSLMETQNPLIFHKFHNFLSISSSFHRGPPTLHSAPHGNQSVTH